MQGENENDGAKNDGDDGEDGVIIRRRGWLFKKRPLINVWKRRYFVLRGSTLLGFMEEASDTPKYAFVLSGGAYVTKVHPVTSILESEPSSFCFQILFDRENDDNEMITSAANAQNEGGSDTDEDIANEEERYLDGDANTTVEAAKGVGAAVSAVAGGIGITLLTGGIGLLPYCAVLGLGVATVGGTVLVRDVSARSLTLAADTWSEAILWRSTIEEAIAAQIACEFRASIDEQERRESDAWQERQRQTLREARRHEAVILQSMGCEIPKSSRENNDNREEDGGAFVMDDEEQREHNAWQEQQRQTLQEARRHEAAILQSMGCEIPKSFWDNGGEDNSAFVAGPGNRRSEEKESESESESARQPPLDRPHPSTYHPRDPCSSLEGYFGNLNVKQSACLDELRRRAPAQLDDLTLLRFLRAGRFDVEASLDGLKADIKWREDIGFVDLVAMTPDDILGCSRSLVDKHFPHWHQGFDRQGRPILWKQYGGVETWKLKKHTSMEKLVRLHVWEQAHALRLLEEQSARTGLIHETFTVVIDLAGMGLKSMTRDLLWYIKQVAKIDSAHNHERLGTLYIINSPSVFGHAYRGIRPWLDPRTTAKFRILPREADWRPVLLEEIGEEQLPVAYGGRNVRDERPKGGETAAAAAAAEATVAAPTGGHEICACIEDPDGNNGEGEGAEKDAVADGRFWSKSEPSRRSAGTSALEQWLKPKTKDRRR